MLGCGSNKTTVRPIRPVRLAYKPYFFSQRTIFFSHNKSANNIFSHDLSGERDKYLQNQEPRDGATRHVTVAREKKRRGEHDAKEGHVTSMHPWPVG